MRNGGPLSACGKPWATEDAARHSKRFLAGGYGVVPCAYGRDEWHLERLAAAPAPRTSTARYTGPDALPGYLSAYARARIEIQPDGCWYWTASLSPQSYGVANLPGGKRMGAHRLVWQQSGRELPPREPLDHQCHNRDDGCAGGPACTHRRCVNPDHLELATPRENVCRGKTVPAFNLAKEKCPEGHDYDRVDRRGWRKCTKCERANEVKRRRAAGIPERKLWEPACSHGHEYTLETTRWSQGNRYCKLCDQENGKAQAEKKRQPCRGCGQPKEPGGAYRYCETCRPRRKSSSVKGPSPAVRKMVLERDNYSCVCCGISVIGQFYSLQHRDARGMGGTRREHVNCPCSLITMLGSGTTGCHGRVESNIDPEDEAKGYALRHGQVARLVPVMVFESPGGSGLSQYATCDGQWSTAAPAGVAA